MKYLISLILLVGWFSTNAQEINPDQAIWNMFNQHNYLDHYSEVMEYYKQLANPEQLQDDTKFYLKLRENLSKNKQDSVYYYFDKLLSDDSIIPSRKIRILFDWAQFYNFTKGDYPKYSQIRQLMYEFIQTRKVELNKDYQFWEEDLKNTQIICQTYDSEKSLSIKRDSSIMNEGFNINTLGIFSPKIKNKNFSILLDTGNNIPCFVSDSIAQELDVRILSKSTQDSLSVNGITINIQYGILDTLSIGNIHIYNLPVIIKKSYFESSKIKNREDSISLQNINQFKANNIFDKTIHLGVGVTRKNKKT